jgi:hypothetical protein
MHGLARMSNQSTSPTLVGLDAARIAIFGNGPDAPSKRSWAEWRARGYFPVVKVGKRVFVDAEDARRALERRFKINAKEI